MYSIKQKSNVMVIDFFAMASPCQLLLRTQSLELANQLAKVAVNEVKRVEQKYSRYKKNNLCHQMNLSQGQAVAIDNETFQLLQYAEQVYQMSDAMFDITSGVLAKIWQFNLGATPPSHSKIKTFLPFIGFNQLRFNQSEFSMPKNMAIDFGGIAKEYCVDTIAQLIQPIAEKTKTSFLINLGGDISAVNCSQTEEAWSVGIENNNLDQASHASHVIHLLHGAVATSGNAKRYFDYQGKRYAHILNPLTGYPIENAPRSVTTFAQSCTMAGSLSTLAQLQGAKAEVFLQQQGVEYQCYW